MWPLSSLHTSNFRRRATFDLQHEGHGGTRDVAPCCVVPRGTRQFSPPSRAACLVHPTASQAAPRRGGPGPPARLLSGRRPALRSGGDSHRRTRDWGVALVSETWRFLGGGSPGAGAWGRGPCPPGLGPAERSRSSAGQPALVSDRAPLSSIPSATPGPAGGAKAAGAQTRGTWPPSVPPAPRRTLHEDTPEPLLSG